MQTSDLTQLNDDDLRTALFDSLVERFDAKAVEEPSIAVVNRMPTAFVVSRGGNLLTLSQGMGLWLLRGDLRWKNRGRGLQTFTVGRAPIQSRLAIMPDHIEGTPEEVLDRIVVMFLEWTAAEVASPRPVAEPIQAVAEPIQKDRSTPLREVHEPEPELAPAPTLVRPASPPKPSEPEPAPPRPAPVQRTTPPSRTYQLLFETARRELEQAKASPSGSKYCLISAGVFVALTVEAFFNDLGSRLIPSWSQLLRLDPLEKAEVLNMELFNEKVDWSVRPFQSVAAAFEFRRALAHAHAETLSLGKALPLERKDTEVPRTSRPARQQHFDDATIQQWITDVRLLIEHFLHTS
jgi:hypothetical protein